MSGPLIRIVYDGDCPFCNAYVRVAQLKRNFVVELIDARADGETAQEFINLGFDLSEGMVVDVGGRHYYGADAMNVISMMSSRSGLINRSLALLFQNVAMARMLYPVLKFGRRVTLAILGRSPAISPR